MNKRKDGEEEAVNVARGLMEKEEFEGALKELERVLYHKMQEKFQLVKTLTEKAQ